MNHTYNSKGGYNETISGRIIIAYYWLLIRYKELPKDPILNLSYGIFTLSFQ